MAKPPDIIAALRSPRLIGDSLSPAQETILRVLHGLPLPAEPFETRFFRDGEFVRGQDTALGMFRRCTGRASYELREYREATIIAGRRSGKTSKIAANLVIFEANFRKYKLGLGDEPEALIISRTKKQAKKAFKYALARQRNSKALAGKIVGEPRKEEYDLDNGIVVGVWPCNFESTRGPSSVAVLCDEVAFWKDEATGANPASAVIDALRPGLATFEHGKLIKISTPWAKVGVVWDDFLKRDARPEVLVWKQPAWELNPQLTDAFLLSEWRKDSEYFDREYGAQFFESADAFLPAEAVQGCVIAGRFELAPQSDAFYAAALDAGFRTDAFAFSIAHRAGDRIVQDLTRSWRGTRAKPVQLAVVLGEIVATLRAYRVGRIYGDQFCSEPIKQALATQGIEFVQTTTLGARAVPIWSTFRTLIKSGGIELLDDPATIAELKRLEEIVTSGGNQRVEASSGHDDRSVTLANASYQAVSAPAHEPGVTILDLSNASSGAWGGRNADGSYWGDGPDSIWH